MTIGSIISRVDYTGNGNVDTYAYTFRIFSGSDLLVTVRDTNDVETTLTLTTDYTVTGTGSASGGNVALVNSSQAWLDGDGDLKTGYALAIRRVVDLTQETDIRNQGDFYPETHEDAFDYARMVDQQQEDKLSRAAILPETISPDDVDMTLPVPSAGLAIGWNATEDGLVNIASAGDLTVTAFGQSLIDDATATIARTTLGFTGAGGTAAAANLDTDSVTTPKILAGAVTSVKLTETVAAKAADYPAVAADSTLLVSASGAARTITLAAASTVSGKILRIKKTDSTTNLVTVDGNASETIDGALTFVLRAQYDYVTIVCDGSNWHVIDKYLKPIQVIHESNAGQSMADNTLTIVDFEDAILDTHGIVTTGASWKATTPRAGNFRVSAHLIFAANTFSTSQRCILHLYRSGNPVRELDRRYGNGASIQLTPSGSAIINLAAAEWVDIRVEQNSGGALALTNTAVSVHVHIEEIL